MFNDYFLVCGFVVVYVVGIGLIDLDGLVFIGDVDEMILIVVIIEWLIGKC